MSCIALLSFLNLSANMETIKVKSKAKEVTVFLSGAEIIHEAEAKLAKGSNDLIIQGLSPDIDRNSIRVKANNGVLVSSFEFTMETAESSADVIKAMVDSIEAYRNDILKIQSDIAINTNYLQMLQKSIDKTVAGGEKGLEINDLVSAMDFYKAKMKETEESTFQFRAEEKALNLKISEINVRLQKERQTSRINKGALKLTISAPSALTCKLNVIYYTYQASWVPYHDINVVNTDRPIKITSKAKVRQQTGVDWEQVRIKLSTSMPSFGKVAPLFSAWILQQPRIQPTMAGMVAQNSLSYSRKAMEVMEVSADYDMVMDEKMAVEVPQQSMSDYVVLSENTLNMTYEIDLAYTIPGNGNVQNIELLTQEITADYKYYCAPKLDPNTYLIAEINDWEKLNLLSGTANITYDETYVGESYIDANSTKDALGLTLGIDKRVAVKKEKINEMSSTRPLGSDTRQDFTYRITVRNNQNKAINMVLKDQYPISTQKQIEVTLSKDTTTPSFNKEEVGVLTWEEEIPQGVSKTYTMSYSVKYPKGMNLNL